MTTNRKTRPTHNTVSIVTPVLVQQPCCCFSQLSQDLLSRDQTPFGAHVKRLDLALAPCCRSTVQCLFLKHQMKWAAPPSVFGTGTGPMRGEAGWQIVGDARIQAFVPAFENIDHPSHLIVLPFTPRCHIAYARSAAVG